MSQQALPALQRALGLAVQIQPPAVQQQVAQVVQQAATAQVQAQQPQDGQGR
jgi:hypothetical protein